MPDTVNELLLNLDDGRTLHIYGGLVTTSGAIALIGPKAFIEELNIPLTYVMLIIFDPTTLDVCSTERY